jgi:hypothetical protein
MLPTVRFYNAVSKPNFRRSRSKYYSGSNMALRQASLSETPQLETAMLRFFAAGRSVALASPASETATAAGAGRAGSLRPRFADHYVTALEIRPVERARRFFGFLIGTHLNEAEPLGSAAELVGDDARADYRAVLRKMLLESFLRDIVGKVANV